MDEALQLRDELREALRDAQDSTRWLRAELRALTLARRTPPALPLAGVLGALSMVGLAWWIA